MARPSDGPGAATRGPWLGSATGWKADEGAGTSERPTARVAADPLSNVGTTHQCEGLGVVDVTAGTSYIYDFGEVSQKSIGRYRLTSQVVVAGAEPLSARIYVDFDLWEESAGVFDVGESVDAAGNLQTNTTMAAVEDAALDGATPDSESTVFVANAADVTDAAAWTAPIVLKLGHLYLLHAIATRNRFVLKRID